MIDEKSVIPLPFVEKLRVWVENCLLSYSPKRLLGNRCEEKDDGREMEEDFKSGSGVGQAAYLAPSLERILSFHQLCSSSRECEQGREIGFVYQRYRLCARVSCISPLHQSSLSHLTPSLSSSRVFHWNYRADGIFWRKLKPLSTKQEMNFRGLKADPSTQSQW